MDYRLKHEVRQTPQTRLKPLSVVSCFFLLVVLRAFSLQVRTPTEPIEVSTKEADENLQVKTLKPDYPPEARVKGIEGTVRLRVVIDERGNVVDTKVVSGNPLLVPSAILTVKRLPYRPFTRGGKRISVTTEIDVPFELHPENTYKNWNTHRDAARQMRRDGRPDAALDELQKALADARKLGDFEVADTYDDIARNYYRDGEYAAAGNAFEERLRTLTRSRVQDETEVANTQSDLAGAWFSQKEFDKAEELLKRAIPVQERYFQQAHFEGTKQGYAEKLAVSVEMLAQVYDLKGRSSEAEPLYKRAVSLGENILHPDIEAGFMRNYAHVLLRAGHPDEAAKIREKAAALQLGLSK